jgi:hypothetical protein
MEWARRTPIVPTERNTTRVLRLGLMTLASFADAGGRVDDPDGLAPALAEVLESDDRRIRGVLHDLEAAGLVELERANGGRRSPTAAILTGKPWGAFGVHGARMASARRAS